MLPDPTPQQTIQLTLFLDLTPVSPPPPRSIEQRVDPDDVWESLSRTTQAQLRLAWLRVLQEVIDDARTD
jgi:hypothetical protein